MTGICPGGDGEPLPPGQVVFKLVLPSSGAGDSGSAQAEMFALSSREKAGSKRLSVCVVGLCTPDEAWGFLDNNPKYNWLVILGVDDIRSIRLPQRPADFVPLEVVWHPMHELEGKPGADGHAGIVGLDESAGVTTPERKFLRKELAKVATLKCFR